MEGVFVNCFIESVLSIPCLEGITIKEILNMVMVNLTMEMDIE
jgi:hypothetical protein